MKNMKRMTGKKAISISTMLLLPPPLGARRPEQAGRLG